MNIIPMNPISSSNIASIGHDQTSWTLAIEFKNGGIYHYHNVDAGLYQALLNADSIGKFFHDNIKSNPKAYPHTKVSGHGQSSKGQSATETEAAVAAQGGHLIK